MTDYAIANRYAKALFEIDAASGALKKRVQDFDMLLDVFQKHHDLADLLLAPHLEDKEKKDVLYSILDGRLDPILLNFLFFLVEKKRWGYFSQIANYYRLRVDKYLGIWEAELITAVPIDAETESNLQHKLEKAFKKQIQFKKIVDPSIIGGAMLLIDNEMLDWSIAGKLNKMKKSLLASIGEK